MKKYLYTFTTLIALIFQGFTPTVYGQLSSVCGIQLYSLQDRMDEDPDACLRQLSEWGLKEVETSVFIKQSASELKTLLDKHGLRCTSHHVLPKDLDKNMDEVIAYAKAVGATWVMSPLLPHKGELTRTDIAAIANRFNDWGKKLKGAGLRFAYHTHGLEFRSDAQGVLFDALVEQTNPEWVSFEADVYWILWGGGDPVKVLQQHGERISALHLKDMRKGIVTGAGTSQKPPKTAIVVLGTGMIDFPAILKLARFHQIDRIYIEDESPEAFAQIPLSIAFLKTLEQP
ncbi:MAG: sugar phosphate isomerase/epimerase [Flavobacteriaceae bacterium]|nr:sugar phosphate isomerase/epimerase [Flavobacteriaceae bacterium]